MSDCNQVVEYVYSHPDVLNLISKIKPEGLQKDLRQEMAVALLDKPCEEITKLFAGNNLVRYTLRVVWNMGTSPRSDFFYTYRKSDLLKAAEYFQSLQPLPTIPHTLAYKAKSLLASKNDTVYEDHEARIFNKYVELGSGRKVARYYNLPLNHVTNIINKVKKELKCGLLS